MGRQPNGRPSIYLGKDGWWHTYYTVGRKPDGKLDRRHIRGRTATAVADGVERLEAKLRVGHVPERGTITATIGGWLDHYLTVVAPRKVRRSTLRSYRQHIRHHAIPAIGHIRLSTPTSDLAEAIEAMFRKLERKVAPATALQVYRILSRALQVAAKRGKITRNPCELVDAPSGASAEIVPLTGAEIRAILASAREVGALARWWVALMLGLRQGEALGLLWDYVDLDSAVPSLTVRWELIRLPWQHGCGDEPCGRSPSACPARCEGGLVFEFPKSDRSRRTLPLPAVLVDVLRAHRTARREARLAAGPGWRVVAGPAGETGGLVFGRDRGGPMSPEDDREEWKTILVAAGVRTVTRVHRRGPRAGEPYVTSTVRVHDARHAAGTAMFAAGMERRELMEWLGHSQIAVSARYTHVPPELMQARAETLDAAWGDIVAPGPHQRRRPAR